MRLNWICTTWLAHVYISFENGLKNSRRLRFSSVRFRLRHVAEGEHQHARQVSPLCPVRPERREILRLPRALLQLRRRGRGLRTHRQHHRGRRFRWEGPDVVETFDHDWKERQSSSPPCFPDRPAVFSGHARGNQEHRHLRGGLLGALQGCQEPGGLLHRIQRGGHRRLDPV